ncbi:hypothetical protein L7F22_054916 [Adiantum nelumboides]|nr:hypothetical protein [Adiantum nelumboides]
MDEQNARASQETCPSTELNAESSNLSAADSVRETLPSAEQNKPSRDLETTALKNATSSQSVVTQLCLRENEDAKDLGELPACIESMEIEHLDPDQRLHACASADMDMIHGDQEDRVDAASQDISMPDGGAALTHVEGLQETGGSHSVQKSALCSMDGSCDEEASLEMLSVAVESFENMQRRSEEGLLNANNVHKSPEFQKEQRTEDASVEMEKDCINMLSMTKSTSESEDNESSVVDGFCAPSAEFQGNEHFLNMLCELAAAHQEERECSSTSKQVASCMASMADNDALCDEPKRLSFVDLLRKQMVHAHALTDLSPDAFYEAFLKQHQEFLGRKFGKDLNWSMPSGSIISKKGVVATLEFEQKLNQISHREGNAPTDKTSRDSKSGDLNSAGKVGGDSKEETGNDERSFFVGDLVWAKVKSHPWWPGQIFDAADASVAAKRIQKPGRTLVAFFGDGTFGWLRQSQLIPFEPNFGEKVKQTTMKSFCRAVLEALEEVSRRKELGLRCSHSGDAVYSRNLFPDLNAGIRIGVRLICHKDIEVSEGQFHPEGVLKFVRTAACSPLYSLSSGVEYSKLCGHVYGFRSFMLSSKRPAIKPPLLNMIKAQKKEKCMQRSELKRRLEQSELVGGLNLAAGKESKRLHLSKDAGVRESSAGVKIQSPRFRSIETLAEEFKAAESDLKLQEQVQGSTWLAKGKRLHVSPDCNEKKKAGEWQSLGPLRDAKKLGLETTVDTSASSDDDNRTLLDITGYQSLNKKKKGAIKSTTGVPSKDVGQQLLKVEQEPMKKPGLANQDKSYLNSCKATLSVMVSQPDPCLPPVIEENKEMRNAEGINEMRNEEENKETRVQLDLQSAGTQYLKHVEKGAQGLQDVRNVDKGNEDARDQLDVRDADLELRKKVKGETLDSKYNCAEDSKEQEIQLRDLNTDEPRENEKLETVRKAEIRVEFEKENETLVVKVAEKDEREDLESGASEQSEKNEREMGVENFVKKQRKRMHFETGDNLGRPEQLKKRRQDTHNKGKLVLSSVTKTEKIIPRTSVKTSKLGLSMRKIAGALKAAPGSLKSPKYITSKDSSTTASVECAASKETKGLSSDHRSPKRPVPASRSVVNKDSLPKLLNTLQAVATDPLSSANRRSSLEGVTSFILKFRNKVFLKSSGYSAATAAVKSMPSIANGHLSADTKVNGKGPSGNKIVSLGTQQTGSKDSSAEREAPLKIESFNESIGGPESQRLVEPDTFCEAKAVDSKELCPLGATSKVHGSDGQNSSHDNETDHDELMTAGNKRPCMQELAVAARKRKSEVLQEIATKTLGKREALKGLTQKRFPEKKSHKETVADTRHYAKSVKHYISRGEGLSLSGKKSPMQSSGSGKVALGLFMQFPENFTLPSESELRELFNCFGTLETFGIRVYKKASTAQVVFKHSGDAEAAWQHARKNRMFGQANVSYKLRHFSLSSKSESRLLSLASAKIGSLDARNLKSTALEEAGRPFLAKQSIGGPEKGSLMKPQSPARDSFLNRAHLDIGGLRVPEQSPVDRIMSSSCEPVPAPSLANESSPESLRVVEQAPVQICSTSRFEGMPSLSPASMLQPTVAVPPCGSSSPSGPELGVMMGPPIIQQQEAIQSPSNAQCAVASNLFNSPSMSSVNVSSGDIQVQMMKLLLQVSVIVSSTALTHKST